MNPASNQRGMMLIEGLLAILIFSMGVLAVVGLQAASVKNGTDAKYRADASFFANQIIGTMWANQTDLITYAHNPTGAPCAPVAPASANPSVAAWLADVAQGLPNADASRQQISVSPLNVVTVSVCWQSATDTTPHSHTVISRINPNS